MCGWPKIWIRNGWRARLGNAALFRPATAANVMVTGKVQFERVMLNAVSPAGLKVASQVQHVRRTGWIHSRKLAYVGGFVGLWQLVARLQGVADGGLDSIWNDQ